VTEEAMADGESGDEAAVVARVGAMGRAGRCRVEIAAGLGLSLAQLAARTEGSPALSDALELAEDAAKAWWAGLSREAWAQGARFNTSAWREAVRWRFGSDVAEERAGHEEPEEPEVVIDLPCNRRGRPLPNGQCRMCGKFHPDDDEDDDDGDDDWENDSGDSNDDDEERGEHGRD
jgi:hypothetical protein